jgi:hypothetical protein
MVAFLFDFPDFRSESFGFFVQLVSGLYVLFYVFMSLVQLFLEGYNLLVEGFDLLVDSREFSCFLFTQMASSFRADFDVMIVTFELIWVSDAAFMFNG